MREVWSGLQRWASGLPAVGRARGARAAVELVLLVLLVVVIGVTDHATGYQVRFGVFYLLPVSVATVRCGSRAALGLALVASLANVGLPEPTGNEWALELLNLVFRFSMLAFVVGLLSLVIHAMDEARASDLRSREFLRYAAHQLRTPTTSVSTTAQGLLAAGTRPADEAALVRLVSESGRMGRLVASMLRFLRLERGDALSTAVEDLRTICREELPRWQDLAAPATISLELPGGRAPLPAPAEAVREVLEILVDNAARHARTGIAVRATVADGGARVAVRDDGEGPPLGQEERIFSPFVSLDGRGGSGLGLAIGQRLAHAIGGALAYEGPDFVLTFPLVGSAEGEADQDVASAGWPGSGGLVRVQ